MNAVEEGHQAKKAKKQAQRDQKSAAPVLNRGKGRRTKFLYMFHKTLRMLYLICTDANLLSNY